MKIMVSEIEETLRAEMSSTAGTGNVGFQPVLNAVLMKHVLAESRENFGWEA